VQEFFPPKYGMVFQESIMAVSHTNSILQEIPEILSPPFQLPSQRAPPNRSKDE
jgi:hypothetical protein